MVGGGSPRRGEALRTLRIMRKRSQVELAVGAGMAVARLGRIENGCEAVEAPALERLLRCLACTELDLQQIEAVARRMARAGSRARRPAVYAGSSRV